MLEYPCIAFPLIHLDRKVSFPRKSEMRDVILPKLKRKVYILIEDGLTKALAVAITIDQWISWSSKDATAVMAYFFDARWAMKNYCLGLVRFCNIESVPL